MPGGYYHQLMTSNKTKGKRSRSIGSASQPSTPRRQRPRRNIPPGSADSNSSAEIITPGTSANNEPSSNPQPQNMQSTENQSDFFTKNPFHVLQVTEEEGNNTSMETTLPVKNPKPPPIFIKNIMNFQLMCDQLNILVGKGKYSCISRQNDTKVMPDSSDSYRAIIRYLKDTKAEYHSYQLKEERALRVVIRNLHHTTPIDVITEELTELGFKPKGVINVTINRRTGEDTTKQALPMFFVDLEQSPNVGDIYNITSLYNTKVIVEKPHPRRDVVQCFHCQQYGHTKGYCNYKPRCVKCGEAHESKTCLKSRDTPAVCALCSQAHPANYKGCDVYQQLKRRTTPQHQQPAQPQRPPNPPAPPSRTVQPGVSYASAASSGPLHQPFSHQHPTPVISHIPPPFSNDLQSILQSFFTEFRSLITPLISLLTTVVSKLIPTPSP